MLDNETKTLLSALIAGDVGRINQERRILADARAQYRQTLEAAWDESDLIRRAEKVVLYGYELEDDELEAPPMR
jgi:hypothetical protein